MRATNNEIHIWSTSLALSPKKERMYHALLNLDEQERAARFCFVEHRRRFIAARATLRQILSLYTDTKPEQIDFSYGVHGKPTLSFPAYTRLQFNLAHSEDLAVYAITRDWLVGIDIEKIQVDEKSDIAKWYFSPDENAALAKVSEHERAQTFYRLWARKEAIIKASGKGLAIPLSSFSVLPYDISETIIADHQTWHLLPLSIHSAFHAALAISHPVENLLYYNFIDFIPKATNRICRPWVPKNRTGQIHLK